MPDPILLETFLAVAAELSFRKAAETLHAAPSTVTGRIKALEEELGARLFTRAGRRVLLTEPGRRLLAHAERLTELSRRTRRVIHGADEPPELRLRLSETLGLACLPDILARLGRLAPPHRLSIATASRGGAIRALRQGTLDVALLIGEPFFGPDLSVEVLRREPLVVLAPPGDALARAAGAGPEDLAGLPLLLTPRVWSARRALERRLDAAGAARPAVVECSSLEIIKRLVMAGRGVTLAPALAARREAESGQLAVLPWAGEELYVSVLLIRHAPRPPAPLTEAFCQAAREVLAAGPL